MESIDRDKAKEIVRKALNEVGDFSGDFEDFTFNRFHPFHKNVFLNSLKNNINLTECTDENGEITEKEFFDIDLSVRLFHEWDNLRDCIDYITGQHFRVNGESGKIELP
jgi:hypothetical protein